jgi:hypothetical protein
MSEIGKLAADIIQGATKRFPLLPTLLMYTENIVKL